MDPETKLCLLVTQTRDLSRKEVLWTQEKVLGENIWTLAVDRLVTRKTSHSWLSGGHRETPSPGRGVWRRACSGRGAPTVLPTMCFMEHLSLEVIFTRKVFSGLIRLKDAAFSAWRVMIYINNDSKTHTWENAELSLTLCFPNWLDGRTLTLQNIFGTHFAKSCFTGRCYMMPAVDSIFPSSWEANIPQGSQSLSIWMEGCPCWLRAKLYSPRLQLEIWCDILKKDGAGGRGLCL